MSASPVNGTLSFIGQSGRIYTVDVYISDVANSKVKLNANGSAGPNSDDFFRAPENVTLIDFSVASGTSDTKGLVLTDNGAVRPSCVLRYANFLNTLPKRANANVGFLAGNLIGAIQF